MKAGDRMESSLKQRKYHSWNYFPDRVCPGLRCRNQQFPLYSQPQFPLPS
uniref:Uncharacterized protein n=1 Tax=Bos indicus x Bos taurus TaxID=30522 RepID=A0A4W2HT25_BOBOX